MSGTTIGWMLSVASGLALGGLGCATMEETVRAEADAPVSVSHPAQEAQPTPGGTSDAAATGWRRGAGRGFVDADGDGVCDRFPSRGRDPSSPGFVDGDGDGVCDNYQARASGPGRGGGRRGGRGWAGGRGWGRGRGAGWGRGWGRGQGVQPGPGWGRGRGAGPAFVDADGDGVCDHYPSASSPAGPSKQ